MTMIGSISAKITADDTEFLAAMGRVKTSLSSQATQLRTSANSYAKWGAAAAAAAAVAGAAIVKSSASSIQELKTLSQVSNTSAQDLQKLSYAASTVNVSQEKLADILKDVNDRIGDFAATGGGAMVDFFEKIAPQVGVTYENFKRLSGKDALQLYVSSLEKANLSQADMTFYMEAIASDSTKLIPLLKNGGAAYAAMAKEAEDLGLVLSDLDIAKASAAAEEMGKISFIMNSAAQQATVELAPAIIGITKAMMQAAKDAGGFGTVVFNAMDTAASAIGVFADGVRGIQVIVQGLNVAFWGVAHVVNLAFQKASEGVDYFVNTTKNNINSVIEGLNSLGAEIPKLELSNSAATDFLKKQAAASQQALTEAMNKFDELALKELPSESIKKWLAEVRANANEAAAAVTAALAGQQSGDDSGGGGGGLNNKQQEELQKKLEAIKKSNSTEMELLQEKFAMEAEVLAQAYENKLIKEEEFKQQMNGITQKYADEETAILKTAKEKQEALDDAEKNAKIQGLKTMFGSLSTLMNTESRKLFEIGKVAAIANATVSAYQGIVKTMSDVPWPYNYAAAAAQGVAAFAQIQNIRSQSFSKGAGSGQTFAGGTPATPTTDANGGQPSSRQVNISLTGSSFGAGSIRDLIGEINEATGDGVSLNVG